MRSAKTDLRPARTKNRPLLKPQPPDDLWEKMDKIVAEDHQPRFKGFTVVEYAERYGIPRATADTALGRKLEKGEVERGWDKQNRSWCRVFRPI